MPGSLNEALAALRGRPRVPAEGRRVHARRDRHVDRVQDARTRSTRCSSARTRGSSTSTTTSDWQRRLTCSCPRKCRLTCGNGFSPFVVGSRRFSLSCAIDVPWSSRRRPHRCRWGFPGRDSPRCGTVTAGAQQPADRPNRSADEPRGLTVSRPGRCARLAARNGFDPPRPTYARPCGRAEVGLRASGRAWCRRVRHRLSAQSKVLPSLSPGRGRSRVRRGRCAHWRFALLRDFRPGVRVTECANPPGVLRAGRHPRAIRPRPPRDPQSSPAVLGRDRSGSRLGGGASSWSKVDLASGHDRRRFSRRSGRTHSVRVKPPVAPFDLRTVGAACPDDSAWVCGSIRVFLDRALPRAGWIRVRFRVLPRRLAAKKSAGTIVVVAGGPGESAMSQHAWSQKAFRSLRADHDLLLVDNRGREPQVRSSVRGRSRVCHRLRVALCRAILGRHADDYSTVAAVDDLAAVLTRVHSCTVDLYGESYGTFFAEVFALRHPQHLQRLVLDGALGLNPDPWKRDALRAVLADIRLTCRANPTCRSAGATP